MPRSDHNLGRYERQMIFGGLGLASQKMLLSKRVLIVGVGGLGSWAADLLARAGVGTLRLVDDDKVSLNNLHRQDLYDEADAQEAQPKVFVAAKKLRQINSQVVVESFEERLDKDNIESLSEGVDLILDGTDNFAARFVINDYSVKAGVPWIFAGVIGAEAQIMTIIPGRTPCLRCVSETPPPPCVDPSCRTAGVLGPAVSAVASIEAMEAIKILTGRLEDVSPYLLKFDLWQNQLQRIDLARCCADVDCPCCKQRHFEYLES